MTLTNFFKGIQKKEEFQKLFSDVWHNFYFSDLDNDHESEEVKKYMICELMIFVYSKKFKISIEESEKILWGCCA